MTTINIPNEGSFAWYLCSGGFTQIIATAIERADPVNIELLRIAYPQMVAAYEMTDWSQAPPGFEPRYNAMRKESEE